LVILLAKYFFKRHIEIHRLKHLFISGVYTFVFVVLLALQPDLGSAIIVFFIWLGLIIVVGIPKKYIFTLFIFSLGFFFVLYNFFLQPYQVDRIQTFLNPQSDVLGSGYNIIQANIALGSGG
jgi:rod shape determining protein RodA